MMPELSKMYFGDELNLKKYPNLKHIVQTRFSAIRGVNMFKDVAVYANPAMSPHSIPINRADDVCLVAYNDGKATEYTSSDLVRESELLWKDHLSVSENNLNPVFLACDLETPLGFSAFLACTSNFKKVFIPGTYNMSHLLKALPKQNSTYLVCDSDFYSLAAPPSGDYV